MPETQETLELPNENIKNKLKEVIKETELVKYEIKLSLGSKKGDNYASTVYKISVSGSKENGQKLDLNMVCKIPIEVEGFRLEDNTNEVFHRESKIYDEILKKMKSLESGKDIKQGFTSYAECFAVGVDNFEEFVLLEDLTCKGYTLFDRMKQLDLSHTQLVIKALGKFHAYSFLLKEQQPEVLEKYSKELSENFLNENTTPFFQSFLDNGLKSAVEKLQFEGIYQEKWEEFQKNYDRTLKDCVKGSLAEPYAIVTHGDCWTNNMMFKYENGVPTEVCLLDWQIVRYSSPILDLVYYIFGCTEKSFRDQHYATLLNIYYESLSTFLKELGGDPEKMFPYSEFQNQLKKFGKFGLGMAIILVPIIVTKEEDVVETQNLAENVTNFNEETTKIYTTRVADVLRDVVDLGYL